MDMTFLNYSEETMMQQYINLIDQPIFPELVKHMNSEKVSATAQQAWKDVNTREVMHWRPIQELSFLHQAMQYYTGCYRTESNHCQQKGFGFMDTTIPWGFQKHLKQMLHWNNCPIFLVLINCTNLGPVELIEQQLLEDVNWSMVMPGENNPKGPKSVTFIAFKPGCLWCRLMGTVII